MRGWSNKVVEVICRHKVDISGLQEVRSIGASARLVKGENSKYKMFRVGNDKEMVNVGTLLVEKWVEAVFDVKSVLDRIMFIKLVAGKSIATGMLVCTLQAGLDGSATYLFYEKLQWKLKKTSASGILFACRDFNGHIGMNADGYEEVHVGRGLEIRDMEGMWILDFVVAHKLVVQIALSRNGGVTW